MNLIRIESGSVHRRHAGEYLDRLTYCALVRYLMPGMEGICPKRWGVKDPALEVLKSRLAISKLRAINLYLIFTKTTNWFWSKVVVTFRIDQVEVEAA